MFYGGYEQAERKRCLIFPDYYEPVEEDFETTCMKSIIPSKFASLSHGKILGTLVGTGIKRLTLAISSRTVIAGKYLLQMRWIILLLHK